MIPVQTPGVVLVDAGCPSCGQRQPMLLSVASELRVTDDGAEIRLKGKSKGASHVCGQLPLPVHPDGQEALPLEDLHTAVIEATVDAVSRGELGPDVSIERDVSRFAGLVLPDESLEATYARLERRGDFTELIESDAGQLLLKIDETRATSGVRESAAQVFALKVNGDGSPGHPLYLPGNSPLRLYEGPEA